MDTDHIFLVAFFSVILFMIARFIEMKFIDKEYKPLKILMKDAVMVFSATLVASYGFFYMNGSFKDFMNVITETKVLDPAATQIFTDAPAF
jgi:hypothetical protein